MPGRRSRSTSGCRSRTALARRPTATCADGPANLAREATARGLTLVHYSSDYVFDGTREVHTEDEPFSPLGVYGQSKAAGDIAAETTPRHFILRTSWVVGDGPNFVATMTRLAGSGVSPRVVDDQHGRLTYTSELARATRHLLESGADWGTYNVSNGGPVTTWCEIARDVFEEQGRSRDDVTPQTTDDFVAAQPSDKLISPRPRHSALDLSKLESTGFSPTV